MIDIGAATFGRTPSAAASASAIAVGRPKARRLVTPMFLTPQGTIAREMRKISGRH